MTDAPAVAECETESMIPGVYNYCDDWCVRCPVTTRCRAYQLKKIWQGIPSCSGVTAINEDTINFTRQLAKADGLPSPGLDAELAGDPDGEYSLAQADDPLARQALAYAVACELLVQRAGWRPPKGAAHAADPSPLDVVVWYHLFLAMKVRRALTAVHRAEKGTASAREDALGSAKIALIAIDRSRAALRKAAKGSIRGAARQLIVLLDLLQARLEARIPGARRYVRLGLDAPAPP